MKGLKFRKIDLHIHTPASKCFKNKNIEADAIIKKSIEKGLDAIAITDHNSAEWIDVIKERAKSTPLVIFPAVEITTSEGIHIVALFDIDKSKVDIENFLGAIDVTPDKYGARCNFKIQCTASDRKNCGALWTGRIGSCRWS